MSLVTFDIVQVQVSAGFDAHWRDPLAGLQFRTSTFHYLAAQVKQLANAIAGRSKRQFSLFLLNGVLHNTIVNCMYDSIMLACVPYHGRCKLLMCAIC